MNIKHLLWNLIDYIEYYIWYIHKKKKIQIQHLINMFKLCIYLSAEHVSLLLKQPSKNAAYDILCIFTFIQNKLHQ